MAKCEKHGTPMHPTPGSSYRRHCEKCVQELDGFTTTEPGILRAQAAALRDRVGHRIPDILAACATTIDTLTARVAELEGERDGLRIAYKSAYDRADKLESDLMRALKAAAQGDSNDA